MIPSGPYSLASCHTVLKLVRSFGTITEPLLDSSSAASSTNERRYGSEPPRTPAHHEAERHSR